MSRDLLDLVRELNTLNDDNLADRVIENSDVQWCLSELQDILEEMPTLTPPNEPLTMEQLRKMDGKPVLYKRTNQWFIVQLNHPDFGDCIITQSGYFLPLETAAERGLYAYPPAHIDLEAWDPCELCGRLGEVDPCYKDGCFKENAPKCDFRCDKFLDWRADKRRLDGAMFCPKCGRPLTPEARAMLEKRLRGCME